MLVAVTQRVDGAPGRDERRDALDQRLPAFLAEAGWCAVPVPNLLGELLGAWLNRVRPAGVVLSGGNDIGACPERDATERRLLVWAGALSLPVVGICRGMQMLAVHAGGSLRKVTGHVATRHALQGEATGEVNSFHQFSLANAPPGYRVTARAPDGVIEAIRHERLPWVGCMWHPEREVPFVAADLTRMAEWLARPSR
ncbi:MAG: gamma-glutamyl-gamma-aminobutyrate hydrolase family protein [Magnetococcales bacterium]|nr:gamma-glutamyl-gamma-aminobutyrate hydrolase family protein [Magnetococcales bacterium]